MHKHNLPDRVLVRCQISLDNICRRGIGVRNPSYSGQMIVRLTIVE